jgi:hypothetical protein
MADAKVGKKLCEQCKKKVGLLGIVCRCGKTTCITHSAAEEHSCNFDYKADGLKYLSTTMVTVRADRIEGRI